MCFVVSLKFVNAKQPSIIYEYKNTRRKPYKTNATIWFNKKFLPQNTFYNILINLLKHYFNKTTLRIEHDNAEYKGTVESHNIVVNKTRILLFYYILQSHNCIDQCYITWLRLFIVPPGTNGCGNSCVNSPEDGPVGPKHVEIR